MKLQGDKEYKKLMECYTDEYLGKRHAVKIAMRDWTATLIEQIRHEIVDVLKDKNAYKSGKLARLILLDYLSMKSIFPNKNQLEFITLDYQGSIEMIMARNSVREHLGQKLEVYFKDCAFDSGDLYPKIKELVQERRAKGHYSDEFL